MRNLSRPQPLKIVVAALTRDRPQMLQALLASWGDMDVPPNTSVELLVVENSTEEGCRTLVETAATKNCLSASYVLEKELGIPFGRNCAARFALSRGADLLAFVDDDEVVARDWLVRLIDGYRHSSAVLLGAPLRMRRNPPGTLDWSRRIMQRSLEYRYLRKERRALRLASLDDTPRVTIVTNNWLAETRLFSDLGLWFDENMRFTGGTDAKFYAEAKKLGLPTGWVADAFVYETIPTERLTFGYQFRRGRDQSNTNFRRRHGTSATGRLVGLVSMVPRLVLLVPLAVSVPLLAGRTYVDLARSLGWIVGRVTAILGQRSSLYSKVTGS